MIKKLRIIFLVILVVLTMSDIAVANIFFPASFYLEGRLLTGWMIGSALVIEFIILRSFLINNTARAIWADFFMNGASALAGIVLIPFSGIILGVFAEKIDLSVMFYMGVTFILAVIVNTFIERLVLSEYFNVSFGLREHAILFMANFLSVGVAGVSIILYPPKM